MISIETRQGENVQSLLVMACDMISLNILELNNFKIISDIRMTISENN
jgi:hypothetical protein